MPSRTLGPWLVVAGLCAGSMWFFTGQETVPYHVGYATFALAFGLAPWTVVQTTVSLLAYTVISGAILLVRASAGVIAWEETAEIPLMLALVLLMVWLVRRRQRALDDLTVAAARERVESHARELLTQRTSHEMRSPLTIARGYVEMLMARDPVPEERADLTIIQEELDRLTRVCERLVRSMGLQGDPERTALDMDRILRHTVDRWSTVADRCWVTTASPLHLEASPERLRVCLDTLIENALRYTTTGDTIRVFAVSDPWGETVRVGVADSGPGLSDEQVAHVNCADQPGVDHPASRDDLSQTGLGLGLIMEVMSRRGGRLVAARAPEGGALLTMVIPRGGGAAEVASTSPESQHQSRRRLPATSMPRVLRLLVGRRRRPLHSASGHL